MDAREAIDAVTQHIRAAGLDYPTAGLAADRFEAGWSVYAPVQVDTSDPMAFLDMPVGRAVFLIGDSGRIEQVSSSTPPQVARRRFAEQERTFAQRTAVTAQSGIAIPKSQEGMRYFVTSDETTGQPLFAVRIDDRGGVQVYSLAGPGWVDAPEQGIREDVIAQRGWVALASDEVEPMLARLQVGPGYWLSVTHGDEEPKLLVRSLDGRTLEGYAVSSAQWESMGYPPNPSLNDPSRWQPVAADDVAQVQGWLHSVWDAKEAAAFDAQAPELVDTQLTEVAVCEGIVRYVMEILKHLPDGLTVGFQPPGGGSIGSWGSGPMGPRGSWNLQVGYRVWGFPEGANHEVFDAFERLFDSWGWSYRHDGNDRGRRTVYARTSEDDKVAYHVTVSTYAHGGVSMRWTSPYYPAKYADTETTGMRVPSAITKDGIQSWKPPVYPGRT